MKALLIVAGILLFIVCLLSVRIRLHLDFSGTLQLDLRILFLRFRLHPRKLTPKRVLRMQKKKEKKARKRAKQPAKADPATSGGTTAPKKQVRKSSHLQPYCDSLPIFCARSFINSQTVSTCI